MSFRSEEDPGANTMRRKLIFNNTLFDRPTKLAKGLFFQQSAGDACIFLVWLSSNHNVIAPEPVVFSRSEELMDV
jgi:hypothetical protein